MTRPRSRSIVQAVHMTTGSYGQGIPRYARAWRRSVADHWRRYRLKPASRRHLAGLVRHYRTVHPWELCPYP